MTGSLLFHEVESIEKFASSGDDRPRYRRLYTVCQTNTVIVRGMEGVLCATNSTPTTRTALRLDELQWGKRAYVTIPSRYDHGGGFRVADTYVLRLHVFTRSRVHVS
jgi:hypothetical protein